MKEPAVLISHFQTRVTKLSVVGGLHFPTQVGREDLKPITDSQKREVDRLQQFRIGAWCAVLVNGKRTAGKDDAFRLARDDSFDRSVERQDLAIYARLSNSPGYQLGVLRSKVQYDDSFVLIKRGQKENLGLAFCVKRFDGKNELRIIHKVKGEE